MTHERESRVPMLAHMEAIRGVSGVFLYSFLTSLKFPKCEVCW